MLKSIIKTQGLTLIEATIAIAVLSLGLLAIIQLFPFAIKISRTAEQSTIAANLAQAKIEEMFSLGYENIGIGTIEPKHRLSTNPENPFYYYQRQTIIEYVDGNLAITQSDTGIKKISVTVYWQSPITGAEKSLPVYVLISQK